MTSDGAERGDRLVSAQRAHPIGPRPRVMVNAGGIAMRLDAIAKVIRSKNAGPCLLTLDVMLPDKAAFAYVAERIASLRQQVARRYGRSENEVAVLPFEPALAVKITAPRNVSCP